MTGWLFNSRLYLDYIMFDVGSDPYGSGRGAVSRDVLLEVRSMHRGGSAMKRGHFSLKACQLLKEVC